MGSEEEEGEKVEGLGMKMEDLIVPKLTDSDSYKLQGLEL